MSTEKGKLLLLGGTGFVGGEILSYATSQGYKVVAVSRRGVPPDGSPANPNVDWRKGNAVDPSLVPTILSEGGFTGVVHAVGMLFEGDINRLASGSGSVPTPGSTYDDVTRKTALNALAAVTNAPADRALPFAFVSAAEARWTFDAAFEGTPAAWLRRYLVAKRAVEDALLGAGDAGRVRPIIVRPSLVWTWSKPGALLPVAAFTIGNQLGLPFVDKPVLVGTLARAVVHALGSPAERGVFDFAGMERLAAAPPP